MNTQSLPLGPMHINCCLDAPDTSLSYMIQAEAHCTMYLYVLCTVGLWDTMQLLCDPWKCTWSKLLLTHSLVITWRTKWTELPPCAKSDLLKNYVSKSRHIPILKQQSRLIVNDSQNNTNDCFLNDIYYCYRHILLSTQYQHIKRD